MSEAALVKIQKDCTKLESELAVYKNSQPITQSCEALITFITSQPEPLSATKGAAANPWHSSGGGGGGCVIC